MHGSSEKFIKQEHSAGELEALKAAMAEAEDLLAEFAIEMRKKPDCERSSSPKN